MTEPHLFPGRRYKRYCSALCVVALLATVPGTLQAATFTVNSTADVVDASPGDGVCATAGAVCTLRAATEEANALAGSDTINLPLGTYNLTLGNELILSDPVTIAGGGETGTIIDGTGSDRVIDVTANAGLSGLTIQNGNIGGGNGGGIRNSSALTLTSVTIRDNVSDSDGGGIHSRGAGASLTLANVTVDNNVADKGAGIYHRDTGTTLTITGGAITNNTAADNGGGIFNQKSNATLSDVTISGNSSDKDGGGIHNRDAEATLTVTGGSITGNTANKKGGGISNQKGTVSMSFANVSGNTAREGGGISSKDNQGSLTVTDSTISSNRSDNRDGGGIFVDKTTATIRRVLLSGNTAVRNGGGVFSKDSTATLINVTLSGNTSSQDGGGVFIDKGGTVTLTNVTITANSAAGNGGGVRRNNGVLQMLNTIVANSVAGGDCSGTITNNGNNLDTDGTCQFGLTAPPLLGPLANNGGPTQTHALLPGSPAIDAGTNLGCPAIDQRGIARPFDGDGDSIATCDIGAYEVGLPFPFLTVVKSALTIEDPISGMTDPKAIPGATERYQVQITNSGPGVADNDSLIITDSIPANTALRILDFDGGNPGPVAFVDGSPVSGLTYTFTSLGSTTDDLEFSNDGGASWIYTPVDSGDGTDPAVTDIRISPKGTLAASTGGGDPSFEAIFKVIVQ